MYFIIITLVTQKQKKVNFTFAMNESYMQYQGQNFI